MLFDQAPHVRQPGSLLAAHRHAEREHVRLCLCYHDPRLGITFTMHHLITNYCLVVILII